jgi:hypothetical protein
VLREDTHLSDEQLVQFGDGECPLQDAARASEHLLACWDCRSRKLELERTISEFVQLHHDSLDRQVPPPAGPRALLNARLHSAARATPEPWLRRVEVAFLKHRQAYVYAALIVALAGMASLFYQVKLSTSPRSALVEVQLMPNSTLTPGATRPVDLAEICTPAQGERDPALPQEIRRSVFREYGMQNALDKDYQVDYLIAPELGGTSDLRNLWPQPYSATIWNADVKDALEDRLHELVCEQKVDLETAQHDLATDWISAYKKYFHTQTPFSTPALSTPGTQARRHLSSLASDWQ